MYCSLDLSELAKAAKKKLQAVSLVVLWDLNKNSLHINNYWDHEEAQSGTIM